MTKNSVDVVVGIVIVLCAFLIACNWYNQTKGPNMQSHYKLYAVFTDMTGLEIGSDVRISGIPVGYVSGYTLDTDSFMAKITMSLRDGISVPKDSMASVSSDGLFGKKYLRLVPGSSKEHYNNGEVIELTQPPINLESLIGSLLFKGE